MFVLSSQQNYKVSEDKLLVINDMGQLVTRQQRGTFDKALGEMVEMKWRPTMTIIVRFYILGNCTFRRRVIYEPMQFSVLQFLLLKMKKIYIFFSLKK